jgi:hypothetical protein
MNFWGVMRELCHFDRALHDEFSVKFLFWFFFRRH